MNYFKILFSFCLMVMFSFTMSGQVLSEGAVRAELDKRGLTEQEVRTELLARGIDVDQIDITNPAELLRIQGPIEEVLDFLENKKKQSAGTTGSTTRPNTQGAITPPAPTFNAPVKNDVIEQLEEASEAETVEEIQEIKDQPAQIYGQHIFRDNSLKIYSQIGDYKPSKNYVLGPGDKISVNVWGLSETSFTQEINTDGYIKPDRMPRYYLSGLTVGDAENILKKAFSSRYYFNANDFEVAVTSAKVINVNIFGEVGVSGTFSISALNSAFNAIVATGGPSDIGSVRKIKLIRAQSGDVEYLDVYKFLTNPVIAEDFYLLDNDYIHIPVAEKVINISGAVQRPHRYELIETEGLVELIEFAGGLKDNALLRNVQITRIENDERNIIDINLEEILSSGANFELLSGDYVSISVVANEVENSVNVMGAVELPGTYALSNGDKLLDVLAKAKLLDNAQTTDVYVRHRNQDKVSISYEKINLQLAIDDPQSPSNITLKEGDYITISSEASFVETGEVVVSGAVQSPRNLPINIGANLKISDAIFLSGGLLENATNFAYLFRIDQENTSIQEYETIDLDAIFNDINSDENRVLLRGDRLRFFRVEEFSDDANISVGGAVRNPGQFVYNPTLTLRDALILSGGLRIDASPKRIDIYRMDFDNPEKTRTVAAQIELNSKNVLEDDTNYELQPFDQIIVRSLPEFEYQTSVIIEGEVTYPGSYALLQDNPKLTTILERAGGMTDEAFPLGATLIREGIGSIVIDLEDAMLNRASYANIVVRAGDVISIPKLNAIVSIEGATKYRELYTDNLATNGRINIAFEGEKSAKYYIDKYAGGIEKDGDRGDIVVEHINGKVQKTKNYFFFKKYPKVKEGSVIRVPRKQIDPEKAKTEKEEIDWGRVLADSIAQATTILSLVLLIRTIN